MLIKIFESQIFDEQAPCAAAHQQCKSQSMFSHERFAEILDAWLEKHMTNLRKTMICFLVFLTLGVGVASTGQHKWGEGFGAAAAATESGVCAFDNACP